MPEPPPPEDAPGIPPPDGFAGDPPEHALSTNRAEASSAPALERERRPGRADLTHLA
ncbi:MAG: hypothetical protein M3O36_18880 [Myxococcota bacterium]|nr:hypothetical protein [Myxococcota bacterium]